MTAFSKTSAALRTQSEIHELYKLDASQYDSDRKLKIRKIYDLIPSVLENRKKRIIFKNIQTACKAK